MKSWAKEYNFTKVSKLIEGLIFITVFINTIVFFKQPFEGHLYYVVFLTLLPLFALKFGAPQHISVILAFLGLVGLINVGIGNVKTFDFIKIYGGLLLNGFFYYYVIRYYKYNIKQIFAIYLKICFWVAVIGFVQIASKIVGFKMGYDFTWIFNKWGFVEGGFVGIRVNSVFSEPATLGTSMAPALYVALYNLLHKKTLVLTKFESIAIAIIYPLSASSVAFIGVFITLFLVTDSLRLRYFLVGIGLAIIGAIFLYKYSSDFQYRVDTSMALWLYEDYDIENTNSSSFVLYNNAHVTMSAFTDAPILGTGLGSYGQAFEKYTLTKQVLNYDFEFNTSDGNSLFFRMLVETGLVGVGAFLFIIFRCFISKSKSESKEELVIHRIISHGIFVMLMLYLLRQGNYFLNGFILFVLLYYYNFVVFKNEVEANQIAEN